MSVGDFDVPEISATDVEQLRQSGADFVLLDVREQWEVDQVSIGPDACVAPMSVMAQTKSVPSEMSDKERTVVVMCHHGVRSAQVAFWLKQNGWQDVRNLAGGIAAYAAHVDPSIGTY